LRRAVLELTPITDVPRLEAEVLLAHIAGLSRITLLAYPDRALPSAQELAYHTLICRRASGCPLPYLIGHVEFYGLEFEVTPEVLIPRPETEMLVDLTLSRRPATIVDVGTGSGCIAVSLAVHLPEAAICAIEISPAALAVAQRNVERHGVADRVRLMAGDVLTPCPAPVDVIVSNPPYVPTGDCASLPVSVRDHEPRQALDGGADGLAVVQQLLAQSPAVLHPGGAMLVEIGADQGEAANRLACAHFPQAEVRVHPDLVGHDRVLEVQT
jgi:release factor glutamine methyltransferase